ncbi:MAG: glutamate 5-kinase [Candidatus Omnitrophica bacterium]|nr:glutamate 5-kinase [Candidatus Omnitrophota bacterium]
MKQSTQNYKRVVIKIGSSLLYSSDHELDAEVVSSITEQIADLVKEGKEIIIVSSGAIALGMSVLKLSERPKELSFLQAAAAVGQHELMDAYRKFFKQKGLTCAQVLLTWEDFSDRKRYLNAKNTLATLLKLKSIPVINENDTVSTEEIKFGDNDRLSALVATLVGADLLIMLSDVDGLLDKQKQVIKIVDGITAQVKSLASTSRKKTCVGGMITKLDAARIVTDSGIPCVISNGRKKGIIVSGVREPGFEGTLFLPKGVSLAARKRWIAFSAKPKGRIIVDDGARKALLNKKSLLSVGVLGVEGDFNAGDIAGIRASHHEEFARGKVTISSKELDKVKGSRFEKEIIHRDNIVIWA